MHFVDKTPFNEPFFKKCGSNFPSFLSYKQKWGRVQEEIAMRTNHVELNIGFVVDQSRLI
jgi:hypothetical protein